MASRHYETDEKVLTPSLVARLRAAVPRSGVVTFRRDGSHTPSEVRIGTVAGSELVDEVRNDLPWVDGQASMVVYIAKPADERIERVVEALGAEHSPAALATALGVHRDTIYKRGAPRVRSRPRTELPSDPSALIAGLAAIRRRDRIEQAWVAQAMGVSTNTLSTIEREERNDETTAETYLRAMVQATRIGPAHLRRQAIEAGVALRAVRELPQ